MTDRATCWSLTIFDMNEVDNWRSLSGWKLSGQYEEGKETGKRHFQGMLSTPQVRFSAVKRVFPSAHIEVARNKKALEKYTSKEETRVATYEATGVPTIFEYQRKVSDNWSEDEYERLQKLYPRQGYDDVAMIYIDQICAKMISEGAAGLEFIAINPMWRSSWKRFYRSIIERNASSSPQSSQGGTQASQGAQAELPPVCSGEEPERENN